MVKVLLDFPWPLDEVLNPYSDALVVLRDFDNFLAVLEFNPVPFISPEDERRFWENPPRAGGSRFAPVFRLLQRLGCGNLDGPTAAPANGPNDLPDAWRKSLRIELGDLRDWRNPQLVVAESRRAEWHSSTNDHEVHLRLEDLPDQDVSRVLIAIESYNGEDRQDFVSNYEAHKYAAADFDPWNVRHCHPPRQDGNLDERCLLPRHPSLRGIDLNRIDDQLRVLRSENWPKDGVCWFLPPNSWKFDPGTMKSEWRKGAFEEREKNGRRGPLDYKGRVWYWHPEEGHWDVQLDNWGHFKVNSRGQARD
jgi:hypothetical protein